MLVVFNLLILPVAMSPHPKGSLGKRKNQAKTTAAVPAIRIAPAPKRRTTVP